MSLFLNSVLILLEGLKLRNRKLFRVFEPSFNFLPFKKEISFSNQPTKSCSTLISNSAASVLSLSFIESAPADLRQVTTLVWSATAGILASGSLDNTAQVHCISEGTITSTSLRGHEGRVTSLAFDRDGTRLVTGSTDRSVRVWDVSDGSCLLTLTGASGAPRFVDFRGRGEP